MFRPIILASCLLVPSIAPAAMYTCTVEGKKVFQDRPCKNADKGTHKEISSGNFKDITHYLNRVLTHFKICRTGLEETNSLVPACDEALSLVESERYPRYISKLVRSNLDNVPPNQIGDWSYADILKSSIRTNVGYTEYNLQKNKITLEPNSLTNLTNLLEKLNYHTEEEKREQEWKETLRELKQ